MNVWNSVFVSEMMHSYKRFLDTKDTEKYKETLRNGLSSESDFERAFTAGIIEWLSSKHFDITSEINPESCTLPDAAFPKMYERPTADTDELRQALPEFQKYNVKIPYFGE